MKNTTVSIQGMHCASCAVNIEKNLTQHDGVLNASVNYASEKALIAYNEDTVSEDTLKKIIESSGDYTMTISDNVNQSFNPYTFRLILSATISVPLLLSMFWTPNIHFTLFSIPVINLVFALFSFVVVFILGIRFHISAVKQLFKFRANMDTLISLGTVTAFFYSIYGLFTHLPLYFETSAIIITLILLGKYLEHKSKGKASTAIQKLLTLGVKKARILSSDGTTRSVDIQEVFIDTYLLVKPGEKIPLDGIIVEGLTSIDESMFTGESIPASKKQGDEVFGSSINQNGSITIKVTKEQKDSILSQIIELVETAQNSKSPIQKLADTISGYFVPIVILISAITFVTWMIFTADFSSSLEKSIAVLVIACPCALGLATPTAIMVGLGRGAEMGIFIKETPILEKVKRITTVVFDKTGTLTVGKPSITNIFSSHMSEKELLTLTASLETKSEHALAKAFENYAAEHTLKLIEPKNVETFPGKGISGYIHNSEILIGNQKLLQKYNIVPSKEYQDAFRSLSSQGKTSLYFVKSNEVQGIIALSDTLRQTSIIAVKSLQKSGKKVVILTGDHSLVAQSIGKELGIKDIRSELLPQEKSEIISSLQKNGDVVAFVGDGINDAPSLALADVGIAMGEGSEIAVESGDIVLSTNNPLKAAQALTLSEQTFSSIKQNLFFAFVYNALAIPLAAFGFLSPMIAAGTMSFSSVSVVFNSLRIRRKNLLQS